MLSAQDLTEAGGFPRRMGRHTAGSHHVDPWAARVLVQQLASPRERHVAGSVCIFGQGSEVTLISSVTYLCRVGGAVGEWEAQARVLGAAVGAGTMPPSSVLTIRGLRTVSHCCSVCLFGH